MLELALSALGVAVAAYTYSRILTEGGMILNPLYNWLDKWIGFGTGEEAKLPWLFYPLIYCPKCVAGQLATWSYFLLFPYPEFVGWLILGKHILLHIFFATFAIFAIKFIEQAYKWNR
jgi:hypothetical protein